MKIVEVDNGTKNRMIEIPEVACYNDLGSLVARKKGVSRMADQKNLNWCLVDDKGTWAVRVRVYDEVHGKTINKSKSTGIKVSGKKSRKAAEREAQKIAQQIAESATAEAAKGRNSFESYIRAWLADKDMTVRANTAQTYREYAEFHIIPALGQYQVKDITWRTLQRFINEKQKDHKAVSLKKYFIVIRGALDDAVRDGAINSNPVHFEKWPKSDNEPISKALTRSEIMQLLKALENCAEPLRSGVTLALHYGLRRSEACGLRWIDIDFDKRAMHIRHTLVQDGKIRLDEDSTKTRGSNRRLTLNESTIAYLYDLRAEQIKTGRPLDKVLAWPDGRELRPDGITRAWSNFVKQNNLPKVRFHDLRHTAATHLAAAGVQPKQLQAFMGHSDIQITLGLYTHVPEMAAEETAAKMDEVIKSICCSDLCSETGEILNLFQNAENKKAEKVC